MLKLSGVTKSLDFEFTDVDGEVHDLKVTQYSIKDNIRLIDFQKPISEMKDEDVSMMERNELLLSSRIVCAVKTESGDYFWKSVDDFTGKGYPNSLLDSLADVVLDLNPYPVSITEKKSKS